MVTTSTRVVLAYADQVADVRRHVDSYVTRAWGSLDNYREADIARFVKAVVPVVNGGQVRIAGMTDVYLAAVESTVLGTSVRPVGIPPEVVSDLSMRGVAADEVYARTGPTVWWSLSKGQSLEWAGHLGLLRATVTAATDLQLAKTHASRHVLAGKDHVVGYERTLGGGKNCDLCVVASTNHYRKDDLMPIHSRCSCSVTPVLGERKESTVDTKDLPEVEVRHHGELGPVLTVKGQRFSEGDE